jgi:hypothetical protein
MVGVSLIVAVVVMLGVGWLAVAIPTVLCIALVSAVAALKRRWWARESGAHVPQ